MEAGTRGRRRCARAVVALALLGGLALPGQYAHAGDYDTVGADEHCLEERNDFRDLDGNGCPEPLVDAGDVTLRYFATGSGRDLRVRVSSLSLRADKAARVLTGCTPSCGGKVRHTTKKQVVVDVSRTFKHGELIGVRVWRKGFVGRFFGYRITKERPRYIACLLRSQKGAPERCHT